MKNQDISLASEFLKQLDADWAQLIQQVGSCEISIQDATEPYVALIRAVAHQQLSTKAGDAIVRKLLNYFNEEFPAPHILLATEFDTLRACGFSGRKVETIRGIAQGAVDGLVPSYSQANTMSNEALIESLVTLKGIGRWTVEMMLIFTLRRLDVLPVDDFGVREGYKRLKRLETAPSPKQLAKIGEAWQPYRSIASWYLWRVPK